MAELLVADILKGVAKRQRAYGGIAIASNYVSTVGDLMGASGAEKYFGMGSARQWAESLRDSQSKLVYGGDEMKVSNCRKHAAAKAKKAARRLPVNPSIKRTDKKDDGLTPGCIMEFDCVLTSKKRDRDRDILEPIGATIDPSMPLLWQHIPMHPIGKMVKIIEQNEDFITIRCAIVDNELGRDAAKLIAIGGLRISHGFVPTKWEPIAEEGDEDQGGWHILEYKVLEVSVVSIPSNTDAEIYDFDVEKLHHPLVKSWAAGLGAKRKKFIPTGGSPMAEKKGPPINIHVHLDGKKGKKADDEDEDKDDENEGDEQKDEASDLASLGRVHLLIEQAMNTEGIDDALKSQLQQAIGELEKVMGSESEETGEEETDDEEADEDTDEEKEGEDDEDKDDEDDEDKESLDNEDDEEGMKDEDEEDDEEKEGVTPDDSEGRADDDDEEEGKSFDLASELFASRLKHHKTNPKPAKKEPVKAPEKKAPKPEKKAPEKKAPKAKK